MIFKHFLGELNIKAEGDNPLRFLNKVRDADIKCKNLYCKNNEVYARIYGSSLKEITKIAEANYMQITILKKKGLVYRIIPYKKRFGIAVGTIVSLAIIFMLSNTTLKIRITGCDESFNDEIYSVLETNGISPGKFIPSMDFENVERNIMMTLKDVSWVSIRSSGGIITVNVSPTTPKPEIVTRRLPCNIVSTKDAQIIDVQLYAGQLTAIIGDGVKKGDLLVSGFVTSTESDSVYYHAQAKIIGQYEENVDFTQPFSEEVKVLSSDSEKRNYLSFFSAKVPLYIGKKVSGEYSYNERTNYFSVFSLKLPIGISHCSYEPYETQQMNYTEDEAKQKILEKISNYERSFLKDCKIVSKQVIEAKTDTALCFSVKYVVQGDITETREILYKN